MKTIFKVFVATISPVFMFTQCEKEPDPNDHVNFPDLTFLDALIEEGIDSNGDRKISYEEASYVTELRVPGSGISEMTGLEAFVNLEKLVCDINNLTSLDVSNNTKLAHLICWANQLTSLDVSSNIELERLWCSGNQLTSLDVSSNTELVWFACCDNQITSLDVSKNILLNRLECAQNELTSLDVSNNVALLELDCYENKLTSLDVSNNTEVTMLNISEMPSLIKVCVWEIPFPPEGVEVDTTGSPNVYFTTECSK